MSYSLPAFRPQIYSYQSRSRFRQYPRQVVTPIPGAGYAVKNLVWGEQAIDLSGLGVDYIYTEQQRQDSFKGGRLIGIGIGLGAAALLGGGYFLFRKRGKKAA